MRDKLKVVAGGVVAAACTLALAMAAAPAALASPGGGITTRVADSNTSSGKVYPDAECQRLVEYYHYQEGRGARCEWHPPLAPGYSELYIGGTSW
jgi:hypothetical protein